MKNSRKILMLLAILVVGIAIGKGVQMYTKGPVSIADEKVDLSISPQSLIKDFTTDEAAANTKYMNQVIQVDGTVQTVVKNGDQYQVSLQTGNPMSAVTVTFEKAQDLSNYAPGDNIKLKALCSGFLMDVEMTNGVLIH